MTSVRFPGKVLAPLCGRPVIAHVLGQVQAVVPAQRIAVATSLEPSDDPLAGYVERLGISVFRGSLDDVVDRFQRCLLAYPCEWFFRVCADSPFLDATLAHRFLAESAAPGVDLVTNIWPRRTFPHGQSLELVRSSTFAGLNSAELSPEEREHVTHVYYRYPQRFRIVSVAAADPSASDLRLSVDVPEDLERLREYAAGSRAAAEAR